MLAETRQPGDLSIAEGNEDRKRIAVARLSASEPFARSPRLSQLLRYLAEETLQGRGKDLSEQKIARAVFERDSSFHPTSDTIVRSHLVRLRQRLEQYDQLPDAAKDAYRIAVPRGQYAVEFTPRNPLEEHLLRKPAERSMGQNAVSDPAEKKDASVLLWGWGILWAVSLVIVALLVNRWARHEVTAAPVAPIHHALWGRLFEPGQTTTLVVADSSLVVLHGAQRRDTSLSDYVSGHYRATAEKDLATNREVLEIAGRRYTSMVDLSLAQSAEQIAARQQGTLLERFARDISVEDLKRGNAILSGSHGANPWVELFEPQMNFTIENDYVQGWAIVKNRRPRQGEPAQYIAGGGDARHPMFGVLAFLPNLEKSRNVLLVEGTSLAGTEAVRDLLFDDRALLPFLKKLARPDGSLPYFELLLSSSVVNGNSSESEIIAYRVY